MTIKSINEKIDEFFDYNKIYTTLYSIQKQTHIKTEMEKLKKNEIQYLTNFCYTFLPQ